MGGLDRLHRLPISPARRRGPQKGTHDPSRTRPDGLAAEPDDHGLGRSRGRLSTKIRLAVDAIRRGSAGGRPPGFDREMYKRRYKVECRTGLLKQARGVATRCNKLAVRYESTIQLTLIRQAL
jgi:transposase